MCVCYGWLIRRHEGVRFKFTEIRAVSVSVMQHPNGVICEQVASVCKMKGKQGCSCQGDLWHDTQVSQCLKELGMCLRNSWLRHHQHAEKGQCWKVEAAICEPTIKHSPLRLSVCSF